MDGEADGLADGEADGLAEVDGLADGEADGLAEGETSGLCEGVAVGTVLGQYPPSSRNRSSSCPLFGVPFSSKWPCSALFETQISL